MKVNAEELKFLVMCYWRFARQHYLVATEYDYKEGETKAQAYQGCLRE